MLANKTSAWKTAFVFLSHFAAGIIFIFLTVSSARSFDLDNGKELISFYVPLPIAVSFLMLVTWKKAFSRHAAVLTLLLFILLCLPFIDLFANTYHHLPQDDGYRFSMAARNIVANRTLWGSDDLVFNSNIKVYIIQPGYRYFIAAYLFIFGNEDRFFQFLCMFLYLLSLIAFLLRLPDNQYTDQTNRLIRIFLVLSTPFVVRLILMGLSEWLAIAIFMTFMFSHLSGVYAMSSILLALLPFIRQNLLIFSLLLFAFLMINCKYKVRHLLLFVLIILLPVYHNLYYAGQLSFLSNYLNHFPVHNFSGTYAVKMVKTFLYHISLYTGIDWKMQNVWANLLSLMFIPFGTFLFFKAFIFLKGRLKLYYLAISLSAILPTLIFGWAYYPRFEWVNLTLVLLLFTLFTYKVDAQHLTVRRL